MRGGEAVWRRDARAAARAAATLALLCTVIGTGLARADSGDALAKRATGIFGVLPAQAENPARTAASKKETGA